MSNQVIRTKAVLCGAAIILFGVPLCLGLTAMLAAGESSPTPVFVLFLLSALLLPVLLGGYVAGMLAPGHEKANAAAAGVTAMVPGLVSFVGNLKGNIERYHRFLGGSRSELAVGIGFALIFIVLVAISGARLRELAAERKAGDE